MRNDGRERKIIEERERKGVQRKKDVEKMRRFMRHNGEERDQKVGDEKVQLHNGGSCNACTMKRCISFRCITKQTTLLNVAIT
jgi:hypothetical protein